MRSLRWRWHSAGRTERHRRTTGGSKRLAAPAMRKPAQMVGARSGSQAGPGPARHASNTQPDKAAALTRNAMVRRRVRRLVLFVLGLLAVFFSPMLVRLPIVAMWDTQQTHRGRWPW